MNKKELIAKLKVKFFKVDEENIHKGKTEAGITIWGISVFDKVGDVLKKLNLTFYSEGEEDTSEVFWGVSEPKPDITYVETFVQKVNEFIRTKVEDETIKFGYIEQLHEPSKRAFGMAIMPDNTEKKVLLSEVEGVLNMETI